MTPGDLLAALEGHKIRLFLRDGFLKYRGPVGAYNTALREEVKQNRQTLLDGWLCPRCQQIVRVFVGFPPDICCLRCCAETPDE